MDRLRLAVRAMLMTAVAWMLSTSPVAIGSPADQPEVKLEGIVVDRGGSAVPGASVLVAAEGPGFPAPNSSDRRQGIWQASARTGPEGRYTLSLRLPDIVTNFDVESVPAGKRDESTPHLVAFAQSGPDSSPPLRIIVWRAISRGGTFRLPTLALAPAPSVTIDVTQSSDPVAVRALLDYVAEGSAIVLGLAHDYRGPPSPNEWNQMHVRARAGSADDGNVVFTALPSGHLGSAELTVFGPGRVPVNLAIGLGQREPIQVRLVKGGRVRGSVMEGSGPPSGVVNVYVETETGFHSDDRLAAGSTGVDGHFEISGLRIGPNRLVFEGSAPRGPWRAPRVEVEVVCESDGRTLELEAVRLPSRRDVRGSLRVGGERSPEGYVVFMAAAGDGGVARAVSGAGGAFAFADVPDGAYRITVFREARRVGVLDRVTVGSEMKEIVIDVR